ncbi:MAG: GHMP family kinase ATP-binding protein [Candidatus Heimdallarchaeaceae archaeon]
MFYSSAPARVCLFGEHQDYLELKVIPAAINLRMKIYSKKLESLKILAISTNLQERITISNNISSLSSRQISFKTYLEAGILALKNYKQEFTPPALEATITSEIPIASGLSSSAALLVSWINLLANISKVHLTKRQIAEVAYDAEHNILGIQCGKMDQYASSFGSIISLNCTSEPTVVPLKKPSFGLIIVDSKISKLTEEVHGRKVNYIRQVVLKFEKLINDTIENATLSKLEKIDNRFKEQEKRILKAVINIKETTKIAEEELKKQRSDNEFLGKLLLTQQTELREGIGVSLPILDKIVKEGVNCGAYGGKLTGAGLGGSVVLLVDTKDEKIEKRLKEKLVLPIKSVEIDKGAEFRKES